MRIKGLVDADFVNYRKPSMFIAFPSCTFKCEKECGKSICQNSGLVHEPIINIDTNKIVSLFLEDVIADAVVCGGLEPFDDYDQLIEFIEQLRKKSDADVVIYTGYKRGEIGNDRLATLHALGNIIIKFGRFIPDEEPHYDPVLGVNLASSNQYAERI